MGPAWEQSGPAVQRYIDTAKAVLLDPAATFKTVRREGGFGAPLVYYLVGSLLSVVASVIWQLAGLGGFGGYSGNAISTLVLGAVVVTAGLFIGSGIVHLVLMLLGGARFGYETTLRTLAYAYGSSAPIGLVPFCGGLIAAVWGLFCAILGLAEMHETSTGKAAGAILIPMVLCCGLAIIFSAAIAAMIGFAVANAN
jgi:hypothetical protein